MTTSARGRRTGARANQRVLQEARLIVNRAAVVEHFRGIRARVGGP